MTRCLTAAVVGVGVTWLAITAHAISAPGRERGQEAKASTARTVWDGVYTEAQATRGRTQYMQDCASCHAEDLRGDSTAPSLVGVSFSFQWDAQSSAFLRMR